MKSPSDHYARNAARRNSDRERRLMGETLDAFHQRENAKPPTLSEVYRANHQNRERCTMTVDLFAKKAGRKAKR